MVKQKTLQNKTVGEAKTSMNAPVVPSYRSTTPPRTPPPERRRLTPPPIRLATLRHTNAPSEIPERGVLPCAASSRDRWEPSLHCARCVSGGNYRALPRTCQPQILRLLSLDRSD